jgi:DNA-binding NarL/FixJ family response regulator
VLKLVAQGFNVSDIAARLHLSVSTVKTHKQHIADKLSLPNQQALYMFIGEHKAAILGAPSCNGS